MGTKDEGEEVDKQKRQATRPRGPQVKESPLYLSRLQMTSATQNAILVNTKNIIRGCLHLLMLLKMCPLVIHTLQSDCSTRDGGASPLVCLSVARRLAVQQLCNKRENSPSLAVQMQTYQNLPPLASCRPGNATKRGLLINYSKRFFSPGCGTAVASLDA